MEQIREMSNYLFLSNVVLIYRDKGRYGGSIDYVVIANERRAGGGRGP